MRKINKARNNDISKQCVVKNGMNESKLKWLDQVEIMDGSRLVKWG